MCRAGFELISCSHSLWVLHDIKVAGFTEAFCAAPYDYGNKHKDFSLHHTHRKRRFDIGTTVFLVATQHLTPLVFICQPSGMGIPLTFLCACRPAKNEEQMWQKKRKEVEAEIVRPSCIFSGWSWRSLAARIHVSDHNINRSSCSGGFIIKRDVDQEKC